MEQIEVRFYYKDGTTSTRDDLSRVLHRIDGPACEYTDGDREWWVDGKRHRIDGPAMEYVNGDRYWYIDGKRHRIDGPAIEYVNGDRYWFVDGKRHRIDGPAIERSDGSRTWLIDGLYYTEKNFKKLMEEVEKLSPVLRLIDPREWVRKL